MPDLLQQELRNLVENPEAEKLLTSCITTLQMLDLAGSVTDVQRRSRGDNEFDFEIFFNTSEQSPKRTVSVYVSGFVFPEASDSQYDTQIGKLPSQGEPYSLQLSFAQKFYEEEEELKNFTGTENQIDLVVLFTDEHDLEATPLIRHSLFSLAVPGYDDPKSLNYVWDSTDSQPVYSGNKSSFMTDEDGRVTNIYYINGKDTGQNWNPTVQTLNDLCKSMPSEFSDALEGEINIMQTIRNLVLGVGIETSDGIYLPKIESMINKGYSPTISLN